MIIFEMQQLLLQSSRAFLLHFHINVILSQSLFSRLLFITTWKKYIWRNYSLFDHATSAIIENSINPLYTVAQPGILFRKG